MGRFFDKITEFYNIMDFTVATDFCTILAIISGENPSFCMLRTTSTVFSALPSTLPLALLSISVFLINVSANPGIRFASSFNASDHSMSEYFFVLSKSAYVRLFK